MKNIMKIKLGDMSYVDSKQYKYYKRLLADLDFYGDELLKKVAANNINKLEQKYIKGKEHAEN